MRIYTSLFLFLIFSGVIFCTSCNECRGNIEHYDFPEEMEQYFGVFRPGNYWVYYNQDSTKKDSFYISDFEESTGRLLDKDECVSWDQREFTLHTTYLNRESKVFYQTNINCCEWIFESDNYLFRIFYSNGTFSRYYAGISFTEKIESFTINNEIYKNVLFQKSQFEDVVNNPVSLYIAPNIGVIKFTTNIDTFTLSKYRLR